jgi:hypothetical protein
MRLSDEALSNGDWYVSPIFKGDATLARPGISLVMDMVLYRRRLLTLVMVVKGC